MYLDRDLDNHRQRILAKCHCTKIKRSSGHDNSIVFAHLRKSIDQQRLGIALRLRDFEALGELVLKRRGAMEFNI